MSSEVETYPAMRLMIDSWRWAGVPFVVRTDKALPTTAVGAVVEFHAPHRLLFSPKLTLSMQGQGAR